jgi:hypothetical protein
VGEEEGKGHEGEKQFHNGGTGNAGGSCGKREWRAGAERLRGKVDDVMGQENVANPSGMITFLANE